MQLFLRAHAANDFSNMADEKYLEVLLLKRPRIL